jgi:hyaluronoglucosaminidase
MLTASAALVAVLAVVCAGAPLYMEAACNYGCKEPCASVEQFGLLPCNETITGAITTSAGDYGGWPTLWVGGDRDGTVRSNGGVPQAANLSLHLELVAEGVRRRVPDANFSGRVVIDFESWRPTWDSTRQQYVTYSVSLVKQQVPSTAGNATAVDALAKEQYEAAALVFLVETIRLMRRMRPRALIGYWGYPMFTFGTCADFSKGAPPVDVKQCGYYDPDYGTTLRGFNDKLAPLWAASSALYPGAYLFQLSGIDPKSGTQISNATWRERMAVSIASQVNESVRLSMSYGGNIPVMPFLWDLYTTQPKTVPVVAADAAMMLSASWLPPLSTSVVMWGFPLGYPTHAAAQIVGMNNFTGPALVAAKKATAACAAARCSGNGWCSDVHPTNATTCVCRAGWNGTACDTAQ